MKSFRIHPSSSNFPCVTQTKRIGPLEMKLHEFFRTRKLKLCPWTFFHPFFRPFLWNTLFHRKSLKNGWKKVHRLSLSLRVRKNSCNFIFKASALWADAFYKSICPSVCLCVCLCVCLSVCSLLRYRLTVFLPPLPEVRCPIFLEIRNPWGKVMERSGLTFEHFCLEVV